MIIIDLTSDAEDLVVQPQLATAQPHRNEAERVRDTRTTTTSTIPAQSFPSPVYAINGGLMTTVSTSRTTTFKPLAPAPSHRPPHSHPVPNTATTLHSSQASRDVGYISYPAGIDPVTHAFVPASTVPYKPNPTRLHYNTQANPWVSSSQPGQSERFYAPQQYHPGQTVHDLQPWSPQYPISQPWSLQYPTGSISNQPTGQSGFPLVTHDYNPTSNAPPITSVPSRTASFSTNGSYAATSLPQTSHLRHHPNPQQVSAPRLSRAGPFHAVVANPQSQVRVNSPSTPLNQASKPTIQENFAGPSLPSSKTLPKATRTPIARSISETIIPRSTYKSEYNPSTIVNDLQLLFGCHPKRPELNHRLSFLRQLPNFPADANLASIPWELATPYQPLGDLPASNSQTMAPTNVPGNAASYLQPSYPQAEQVALENNGKPRLSSTLRHEFRLEESRPKSAISVVISTPPKSVRMEHKSIEVSDTRTQTLSLAPNNEVDLEVPNAQVPVLPISDLIASFVRSASSPVASLEVQTVTKPITRKRGRPRREVADTGHIVPSGDEQRPKKRGRPFKYETFSSVPRRKVGYYHFLCEWQGCTCRLVNLKFLRGHLHNFHGKPKIGPGSVSTANGNNKTGDIRSWICRWGKCAKRSVEHDHENHDGGTSFENIDDWMRHLETSHLIPMAWWLGDGPQVLDRGTVTISLLT